MTLDEMNQDNVEEQRTSEYTQNGGNFLGEITVPAGLFIGNQLTKRYKNRKSIKKRSKRVKKSKRSKRSKK